MSQPQLSIYDDLSANRRGLVRRNAPVTSKKAATLVMPQSGTLRMKVLVRVWRAKEAGITRDEIAELSGLSPNTVRPRIAELMRDGWVKPTDRTRKTPLGRAAEVLDVTDDAYELLRLKLGER